MDAEGGMCGVGAAHDTGVGPAFRFGPAVEISRLRRENDRLRTERDILKKAVAIFSEPPDRPQLLDTLKEFLFRVGPRSASIGPPLQAF
jgi:hypothetical protein